MARAAIIGCAFCGEESRPYEVHEVNVMAAAYMTHLLESHWDKMVEIRETHAKHAKNLDAWKTL